MIADSFWFVAILLTLVQGDNTCERTVVSEKQVMDFIFRDYSRIARPRKNALKPVEITLALHIRGVHDLVERENTLVLDGYLEASWEDEYLIWNATFPYSCLQKLVVPQNSTWLPDLSIVNAPNGIFSLITAPGFGVDVFNDGTVQFSPGGQIVSQCEFDVTYFPFDIQLCQINFESWNHDIRAQTFKFDTEPFLKVETSWTENRQWSIEGNSSFIKTVKYHTPVEYAHASFAIVLQRKALFYYINIIVPSLIISVVELGTFALPIDEVTKIHISFTCLLAYSVFQGMVIADLPRSGDSVPLLSLYIDLQMAYIGLIALMGEAVVFLLIRKAKLKKHNPSPKVVLVFSWLARILHVDHNLLWANTGGNSKARRQSRKFSLGPPSMDGINCAGTEDFPSLEQAEPPGLSLRQPSKSVDNITALVARKTEKFRAAINNRANKKPIGQVRRQWMLIAEVIERLNIVLYLTAITTTPLIMFSMVPKNDTEAALAMLLEHGDPLDPAH